MDAPNDRVAWDRDGSLLTFVSTTGGVTNLSASDRRIVNSESESGIVVPTNTNRIALVFSVPMDCTAVFISLALTTPAGVIWSVETSKDTTNGLDGVWDTQYLTNLSVKKTVKPNYRISSQLFVLQTNSSSSDLRGIRLIGAGNVSNNQGPLLAFHVYGTPSSMATKDRLAFWHPTTDVKLAPAALDWGNVPRSSSADKSFRIKNLSETLDATDIDLYVEALTPGTVSVAGMHTISADSGATFLTGQSIPKIAPGEVSGVFIVRRTVPANAQVSVWSARIAADVNLWKEPV